MSIRMLIDASHQEETRVAIVDGNRVEDFDYESSAKKQLKGSIYLAKVTRVEPSLQAAFVDYGGNRHGFLAFSEIHPDYYQIPVADREALIAQEAAANADLLEAEEAAADAAAEKAEAKKVAKKPRGRGRKKKDPETSEENSEESDAEKVETETAETEEVKTEEAETEEAEEAPAKKKRKPRTKAEKTKDDPVIEEDASEEDEAEVEAEDEKDSDDAGNGTSDEDEEERLRIKMAKRLRYKYKIQEVIKKNQIILIQVVKEERGNKGAALTTYLSLPGRYCVLMPNTLHGGGVSRKIANVKDRKKLKNILSSLNMPKGHACIIRTAGSDRTKPEISRDYDYLKRMWEAIREHTLKSIAPSQIYEEGNLIKRSIRDLYTKDISEILVEGEKGYNTAKNFMAMLMPNHAKKIHHYEDAIPLFQRYRVETHLDSMYSPTAQLKSGGYIVINPTEALVSIDVNSGRATKEHNIEETAIKTNLEAAEEVARQLKLRDMAGLVVIDFIDMEDNRNNRAVERKMKACLKSDRARIQVGRISSFGLMEMSRQRLRVGVLESSTTACPHCEGSGLLRSVESQSLHILRIIEEEGIRAKNSKFTVYLPSSVAVYILNNKRNNLIDLEKRYDFSVSIAIDNDLTASAHRMEKSGKPSIASQKRKDSLKLGKDVNTLIDVTEEDVSPSEENTDRPKRRRRRRRNQNNRNSNYENDKSEASESNISSESKDSSENAQSEQSEEKTGEQDRPRRRRRPNRGRRNNHGNDAVKEENKNAEVTEAKEETPAEKPADEKPAKSASKKAPKKEVKAEKPVEKKEEPKVEKPKKKGWWSR
ncbi:MAG: ribonuclease E/G [Kordiimonadaceae bacterium]|nr:ribonuclease E/G [Kordiimonadaceae bacterium]MBT6035210.1 ribonuclease E/G [Kordiimonadaceae bacterium]MBT7582914.1 ribonuclease E/G [Kordiimonadaceae bacterium]